MAAVRGLNGARAPEVESLCLERRLVEVILGAALLAEVSGKSRADESLLEESSRYSLFKPRSFLSFGGWGSSSFSFFGREKVMVVANRDFVALEGPSFVNGEGSVVLLRVI